MTECESVNAMVLRENKKLADEAEALTTKVKCMNVATSEECENLKLAWFSERAALEIRLDAGKRDLHAVEAKKMTLLNDLASARQESASKISENEEEMLGFK